MPNSVSIHWDDSNNEWNAYVFTDREGDDWGKCLCHKDLDPPNIKRLAFVAHHDEIMALLSSNDVDNALYGLVMNSLRELEEELRASFDETYARKLEETPRIGESKEDVAKRLEEKAN